MSRFAPAVLHSSLAALLCSALLVPAAWADSTPHPESLRSRITLQREAGLYARAAASAETLATVLAAAGAQTFERQDATRLVTDLKQMAALPESSQARLAEADRMASVVRRTRDEGRHTEARELARRQLTIRSALLPPSCRDLFDTFNALANLEDDTGRYREADLHFQKAIEIMYAIGGSDHPDLARAFSNLGILRFNQMDFVEAEALFREALRRFREAPGTSFRGHVALAANNLGVALGSLGRIKEAKEFHHESMSIFNELDGPNSSGVAQSLGNLGSLAMGQLQFAEAESVFRRSLSLYRSRGDSSHVANGYYLLGNALQDQRRLNDAEAAYQRSLLMRERLGAVDNANRLNLLAEIACIRAKLGDLAKAESLLLEVSEVYERTREALEPGASRAGLSSAYSDLAAVLLLRSRPREAWDALQKGRSRGLLDLLPPTHTGQDPSPRDSLLQRRATLEDQARVLRSQAPSPAARARLAAIQEEIAQVEVQRLESEHRTTARLSPGRTRRPATAGVFPLARVQAALASDEAIIGWLSTLFSAHPWGKTWAWAYVVRSTGDVRWIRLPTDSVTVAGVERACGELETSLSRAPQPSEVDDWRAPAGVLFKARFQPLLPALDGVRRLIVVPSGDLANIPIEVLPIGPSEELILDRYVVTQSPSASVFVWLRERAAESQANQPGDRPRRALIVADPAFPQIDESIASKAPAVGGTSAAARWPAMILQRTVATTQKDFGPLVWAREEARAVARFFPVARTLVGNEATRLSLQRLARADSLQRYDVIHFATHALIHEHEPLRSALVLSQASLPDPLQGALNDVEIEDGLLTAEEMLRDWHLDADLVTLSACRTLLGRSLPGEGNFGFLQALLPAGARNVLASRWAVDDESTTRLMGRFYETWLRDHSTGDPSRSKGEVLRTAKLFLRDAPRTPGAPKTHPYYWAAFALTGAD